MNTGGSRAEREPITGVWCVGAGPRVQGRAPGQESGGEAPLKLNAILYYDHLRSRSICPKICFFSKKFVRRLGVMAAIAPLGSVSDNKCYSFLFIF